MLEFGEIIECCGAENPRFQGLISLPSETLSKRGIYRQERAGSRFPVHPKQGFSRPPGHRKREKGGTNEGESGFL